MDHRIKLCGLQDYTCTEFLEFQSWNRGLIKHPSYQPSHTGNNWNLHGSLFDWYSKATTAFSLETRESKSKLWHVTPLFVLPVTQHCVVGLVVGSVLFLFLTSYKYVLHLAKGQLGTKKRTAKWCFRSQERSMFEVNCTSLGSYGRCL